MDLKNLSLQELETLQGEVAVAISDLKKRKKVETIKALKALAQSKGFSLEEILGNIGKTKTKTAVAPKYVDPSNPDNTWSGRGRKPKWLVAALESDRSLEDFAL